MFSSFLKINKSIVNRSDFIHDKKKFISENYWPINKEYIKDNSYYEDFYLNKNNPININNGKTLVFSNYSFFKNKIYNNSQLMSIQKLVNSFKNNSLIFLDGEGRYFFYFKKNIYLLGVLPYKILFSNLDRAAKFIKIPFYYFQLFIHIIFLLFTRPKNIVVAHQHKYWQIVLAAKILKIKTFHFMHGIIFIGSTDNSREILNKNIFTLPENNIITTKVGLKQLISLSDNKYSKYYYLRNNNIKVLKKDFSKYKFITIIGTWFLNDPNNHKYINLLKKLVKKLQKEYTNYTIFYKKHSMLKNYKHIEEINGINLLKNSNQIFLSSKTVSYFSTLSIELNETYDIPAIFIALNDAEENYLNKISEEIKNSDIIRL